MNQAFTKKAAEIIGEALAARWDELSPLLLPSVIAQANDNAKEWSYRYRLSDAVQSALDAAVRHHLATTYAPQIAAIAQGRARREVERRAKRAGLTAEQIGLNEE